MLREEYSEELITSGERGKHVQRYREGTNVVVIELRKAEIDLETLLRLLND